MPANAVRRGFSYWRIHVFSSVAIYAVALGFGVLGSIADTGFAMKVAAPARYVSDGLALVFLITASAWGWKRWWPVVVLIFVARIAWMLAKVQHWPVGGVLNAGIYAAVFIFYGIRFQQKPRKTRLDLLKLCWVTLNCATVIAQFFPVRAEAFFGIALVLSALLQLLVILQWRLVTEHQPETERWDFEPDR